MNPALIRRAIQRHTRMKDRPAYAELLAHARARGDVWMVPQAELAGWWERRQKARLTLSGDAQARVECALEGAVVELDAGELRVPPFDLDLAGGDASELRLPTYDPAAADQPMLDEVLGHLGYGHVRPATPDARADLAAAALDPIVARLREMATVHQRFGEPEIDGLRQMLRRAHHHRGLPDLRLWPLPHAGHRPWRVALSVRYDVDSAIGNMDSIHGLEARYGLRSTAYLRPVGCFYGQGEIRDYARRAQGHELTLHGEFVTTAERRRTDEQEAAVYEKRLLEELIGQEAAGVCLHGGELRINTTPRSWRAVEAAGFRYDTMYRNDYYLPLHLPGDGGLRRTLSIGQHFADISVPLGTQFSQQLARAFVDHLERAAAVGGVFVPVMHPLYFDVAAYLRNPRNTARLFVFLPRFMYRALRMRRGQLFVNQR